MQLKHSAPAGWVLLLLSLVLACGGGAGSGPALPLPAENLNLVFVVSPDLAYHTPGDVHPDTANLTPQGLHRALLMGTYLKERVLGGRNVDAIHALEPTTHLQTAQGYPDMAGLGFVQHFAVLNRITLPLPGTGIPYTANSFPIHVAYGPGAVPDEVAVPKAYCPDCRGLAFQDTRGHNGTLLAGLVQANAPGFHVFSAPWETIRALLADVDRRQGYGLCLPADYLGTNVVYALTIAPTGQASLLALDSGLKPAATYPALPSPVALVPVTSTQQPLFSTTRTGGVDGARVPANINTHQTVYFIRHSEAHPDPACRFENGNIVGAGKWRALALADALRGKVRPDGVYSVDPAQWFFMGHMNVSYVRPSLTVLPYVIAHNLPYRLLSAISILDPAQAQLASDFFFTGGRFSNRTLLVAWESSRIKPILNALLGTYGAAGLPLAPTAWPSPDYDTIWTVTLDAQGNLTVDDTLCEGIETTLLPETAPPF